MKKYFPSDVTQINMILFKKKKFLEMVEVRHNLKICRIYIRFYSGTST